VSALTPREVEALRLAALGLTDAQIAHEMGISAHHVAHVVASARHKLGAASRTQAVAIAVRMGLA
jgi:LuxR family quorum sensing-dependent transcriptional regulator